MVMPKGVILFCGGGVMDFGMRGRLNVALAVDFEKWPLAAYRLNHPGIRTKKADLLLDDPVSVLGDVRSCDILHASPPCQPFSSASGIGQRYDRRRQCYLRPPVYAALLKPKVVIVENVPKVQTNQGGVWLAGLKTELKRLGYKTLEWELNSLDFGSCQSRTRLYVVGYKGRKPEQPLPTHGHGLRPIPTLGDMIGSLTEAEALADGLCPMSAGRMKAIHGTPQGEVFAGSIIRRMSMSASCPTLRTSPSMTRMSLFVHPIQDRHLSVVEYKHCFGIPGYRFPEDMPVAERYAVLGNGNPEVAFSAVINSVVNSL